MKDAFEIPILKTLARRACGLALMAFLLGAANPALAARIVSDSAELKSTLASARPGDVVQLKPGEYQATTLNGLHFERPVVITSSDASRPATLVGLTVNQSSGLSFSNLELTTVGAPDHYFAFRVAGSDHISFSGLAVHGDRASDPTTQLSGFYISKSNHIAILNSSFDHMKAALTSNNNIGITVNGNLFSFLDKGGVEMGGCADVILSENTFRDFVVSRSTHPDAIQLYTAGTTSIPRSILIRGNLIYRGRGDAMQGIFIQDEKGTLPYTNIEIVDNAVIGGMWNSIYLKHAAGLVTVKDNVVASWAGLDMPGVGTAEALKTAPTVTKFVGWICIRGDNTGATIEQTGNAAQLYMGDKGPYPGAPSDNRLLGPVNDGGAALVRGWLAEHHRDALSGGLS